MNALERFRAICRFERPNNPFLWGVPAWNETWDRWLAEGMPVDHVDNMRQVLPLLVGYQDQKEGIRPKGAIGGRGATATRPGWWPSTPYSSAA